MLTAGFCSANHCQYLPQREHSRVSQQKHSHDFRNSAGDGPSFIKHHSLDLQAINQSYCLSPARIEMLINTGKTLINSWLYPHQAGIPICTLNYLYSRPSYAFSFIPHTVISLKLHYSVPISDCQTTASLQDLYCPFCVRVCIHRQDLHNGTLITFTIRYMMEGGLLQMLF